ncbi:MAG: ABC transporter permease [Pseudomonadota bacterium]
MPISLFSPARIQYLRVVILMVKRELKVKYRGTVLGYLWSMLNPLLFMLTISFVFSHMMKGIPNYNLFVLAGILSWNLSSVAIVGGTHSISNSGHLVRKIKMPIWVFPLVPLASGGVNFLLALIPFVIVLYTSGNSLGLGVIALPVVFLLFSGFLLGAALGFSTLNVFFKDVGHVLEPVLQLVFYATPIIYDRHNPSIPEYAARLINLNPFTHYIEAMRSCLIYGEFPSLVEFLIMSVSTGVSLAIGFVIYKKAKKKIIFHV